MNSARLLPALLAIPLVTLGCSAEVDLEASRLPAGIPPLPHRPHVVLVLVDTLRADRLEVYGYQRPTSPNLAALAEESFVFEEARGAAPWTLPSVVGMMTSTLPLEHRVLARGQTLSPSVATLPVRLQEMGFTTAGFITNPYAAEASGLTRGYDHLVTDENEGHAVDLKAIEAWLDANPEDSHFLYVHSTEPHRPYKASAEILARFGEVDEADYKKVQRAMRRMRSNSRKDFEEGKPLGTTPTDKDQQKAIENLAALREDIDNLYDAGVAWGDANTGALIELLKERGMWESTLFVFVSDHGEELYDHGGWLHHRTLFEELMHVPMIAHFPGQETGRRVASSASLIDVFPTIMDYLGLPADGLKGVSLLGAVGEEPAGPRVVANRFNQMIHYGPDVDRFGHVNLAVIDGDWKGIWNVDLDSFELYNLASDPTETQDLSAQSPDIAGRLLGFGKTWLEGIGEPLVSGGEGQEVDQDVLERLRALGYAK